MKISKIYIHNYYQFQDIELDLTYPEGHKKAGKPLDKICIIGQSGTGKTSLLELIKTASLSANMFDMGIKNNYSPIRFKASQQVDFTYSTGINPDDLFHISLGANDHNEVNAMNKNIKEPIIDSLLYFPCGLSNIVLDNISKLDFNQLREDDEEYKTKNTPCFIFNKNNLESIWELFYQGVRNYQREEANYRISLTKKLENENEKIDVKKSLKEWKEKHPNPLEKIATECLDVFLKKFHLSVKTDLDDVSKINILQIFSKATNSVVPYEKLSSGTRQIIHTGFPIYQLIGNGSLILIDQPEDSLYPDIQQELIPYYTSFDKDKTSQFFFATHSPIIASAFEPWEIVELKFNSDGKIMREKYYDEKEENHIKNYHTDPRYLRWDSILMDVFDLKEEGNVDFRTEKLMEFTILKREIEKLESEGKLKSKSKEVQDIVNKYVKVGNLIGWINGNSKR